MEVSILAILIKTKLVAKEDMTGLMGKPIMVIGKETRCTDMVYYYGVTARSMKANL